MSYDPASSSADDFINHQEILDTLIYAEAHKNDFKLINELLEKEMSKEQNEGYNNQELNKNVEPRFKYIPKKRTEIISAPSNTKKYKYYSDNFKSKKNKKEKIEEKNDNYNFKSNMNNSKNQKKESNNFKKKEKIENFSKYEKENDIKEPPLSFNQNTNTGKIVDKRLDFSEFRQKQNNNINSKKKNIPTTSYNKSNKSTKINPTAKSKYNNKIGRASCRERV
mgnify:CR=1 FL=1